MKRAGAMGSALRCLQVHWATILRDAWCNSLKACIQSLHLRITLRVLVRIRNQHCICPKVNNIQSASTSTMCFSLASNDSIMQGPMCQ